MKTISAYKFVTGVIAPIALLACSDAALAQLACPSDASVDRTTTTTQLSPYRTNSPYRAAIDKVNVLQYPETSECLSIDEIKLGQIIRNQFYMNSSNQLLFSFSSTSKAKRLELRGRGFTRAAKNAKMDFTYTIPNKAGSGRSPGFTIGQILTEKVGNASAFPAVRLEVIAERRADGQVYTNFLFAILKTADSASAKYVPLGPVADNGKFGTVSMTYGNTNNEIFISHTNGGTTRTASMPNVSTNPDFASGLYFKNGCYLQSAGTCQVTFGSLSYTNIP
jgi:hypothetical protein